MNTTEYLFDGPHWEIGATRGFENFFRALPALVPPEATVCLCEGEWDDEVQSFLQHHHVPAPEGLICASEFLDGEHIPATAEALHELAQIANHHAPPEIAMHVSVSLQSKQILEMFDATCDPFSVALSVHEERVQQFCSLAGVQYKKRH
jgi:hypothetical protein